MIRLTRLNHVPVVLNADLIEFIDTTPDTVITLTTAQKLVVLESADEVVDRVIQFRRAVGVGVIQTHTPRTRSSSAEPFATPNQ